MGKIKKQLFVGGNFNKTGQGSYAEFVKEVSNGKNTYKLWHTISRNNYHRNELDVYYLFVEVGDYLVPVRETEYSLINRVGYEAAKEILYDNDSDKQSAMWREGNADELRKKEDAVINECGNDSKRQADYIEALLNESVNRYVNARDNYDAAEDKRGFHADFIGAAVLGELDNCVKLAAKIRKDYDERERQRREQAKAEAERVRAERLEAEKKELEATIEKFKSGGQIDDGRLLVEIAEKYGVKIALRTKGWILNSFANCTIKIDNGQPEFSVRYWKKKNATGSTKIYEILSDIYTAVSA